MTKKDVYNEIENKWNLNDNTTLGDIKKYYKSVTNNNNFSIGVKVNYLYNYILDSMLKDDDITEDLYNEIKRELENEG
jgi:hypothetical protein